MRELEVQKFLRAGGTLGDLELKHAVKARRHGRYPELVLLKYDQIESDFSQQLVRECRGLILNSSRDWDIIAYPYDKFFNHLEPLAAKLDWSTAKVWEKADGSLLTLFHYQADWHVATSGTPDAETPINDFGVTFKDLFWETWAEVAFPLYPDYCYMLELCGPLNRVVVPHQETSLYLHGVRDMTTLEELDVARWETVASLPRRFDLSSAEACRAAAEALDPLKQEGFVCCDAGFNRVKVKSPRYVELHHAKDGASVRALAEIVRRGETAEVAAHFPELRQRFDDLRQAYDGLCIRILEAWDRVKGIADRKTFAGEALKYPFSGCLFGLLDGRVRSIKEAVLDMKDDTYLRLIGARK